MDRSDLKATFLLNFNLTVSSFLSAKKNFYPRGFQEFFSSIHQNIFWKIRIDFRLQLIKNMTSPQIAF